METKRFFAIMLIIAWMVVAMMLLVSCGGGGGDSTTPGGGDTDLGEVRSGVFLDSAVEGLNYATETLSGITDAAGMFNYRDGETVTFSVGGTVLGTSPVKPILTPLDLVEGATDVTHPRVTSICRMLQSLDLDGRVENGIKISADVAEIMADWSLDLGGELDGNVFVNGFFEALNAAGIFADTPALVDAEKAVRHMKLTLTNAFDSIDVTGRPFEFWSSGILASRGAGYEADQDGNVAAPTADDKEEVAREIEEADIIKIEGTNLYILNQYRGLIICDISTPDAPVISGRLAMEGRPNDMYIRNNRAYVIASLYREPVFQIMEELDGDVLPEVPSTRIYVVDLNNSSDPQMLGTSDLTGDVTDSRIVGDILYMVLADASWRYFWDCMPVDTAIGTSDSGTTVDDAADDAIAPCDESSYTPDTYVVSFSVADPASIREVDRERFDGSAWHIHVTDSAIFVASGRARFIAEMLESGTLVTYVDISDPEGTISVRGDIVVTGEIEDKFKMDYANGYFRVCTWDWRDSGVSNLFVIDTANPDELQIAGSVELGRGEQLFATRFDGDKAYMVTYERVDPLWVVDLSDPANPEVAGELEVPGWSTYIEPMGDRLIALGVDDTDGRKVAISLFDVADAANPGLIQRVSFGDGGGWIGSPAYEDIKALTVVDEMGLILLPYSVYGYDGGTYFTENRLQLVDYSSTGLAARGWVTQKGSVLRSRSVSDRLFSVSADELQVIDATDRDNPQVTASRTLAANITDFTPLANGYGIQTVSADYTNYVLRAVPLADPELGEPVGEVDLGNTAPTSIFVNGNMVYVVSNRYGDVYPVEDMVAPYYGTTEVQVVDFSTPAAPRKRGRSVIEGSYSRTMALGGGCVIEPFYSSGQVLQLKPDVLVFAGRYDHYYYPYLEDDADSVKPDGDPASSYAPENAVKFIVMDMSNPDMPVESSRMNLDTDYATSWLARQNVLYYSFTDGTVADDTDGTRSQYFLGRVDLTDHGSPVELASVNIPGICVGMDDIGRVIYTMDYPWRYEDPSVATFNALKLENDTAYLLDSVDVDNFSNKVVIADGLAYLSEYAWYRAQAGNLVVIDLLDPENLEKHVNSIQTGWIDVFGAKRSKVFIGMDGGTGCFDTTNPGELQLDEFRTHYGYGNRVVFSDTAAYLPMGYYGLWVKNL